MGKIARKEEMDALPPFKKSLDVREPTFEILPGKLGSVIAVSQVIEQSQKIGAVQGCRVGMPMRV